MIGLRTDRISDLFGGALYFCLCFASRAGQALVDKSCWMTHLPQGAIVLEALLPGGLLWDVRSLLANSPALGRDSSSTISQLQALLKIPTGIQTSAPLPR